MWTYISYSELYHYGIPGMKWGKRKARPVSNTVRSRRSSTAEYQNMSNARAAYKQARQAERAAYKQARKAERNTPEAKAKRAKRVKAAAITGAAVVATALAAYGGYKASKVAKNYVKSKNESIAAKQAFNYAEEMFNARQRAMMSGPGRQVGTTRSYAGEAAASARASAAQDSFRTALRNVNNYRKSGNSLKYLPSADDYIRRKGSSITFG